MMHYASTASPAGALADQRNLNCASGVRLSASPIPWLISLTRPRNLPRVHRRRRGRGCAAAHARRRGATTGGGLRIAATHDILTPAQSDPRAVPGETRRPRLM